MNRMDKYYIKRYGITVRDKELMLEKQKYCCACCEKPFGGKKAYVDHEHCLGYSRLPPEEKRNYIRGLLCYICNKWLVAKNTRDTIGKVYFYLKK